MASGYAEASHKRHSIARRRLTGGSRRAGFGNGRSHIGALEGVPLFPDIQRAVCHQYSQRQVPGSASLCPARAAVARA